MIKNPIKKIFNNLIRPLNIPKKIYNQVSYYLKLSKYDRSLFEKEQNSIFKYFGLNREKGIENLKLVKHKLFEALNTKNEMGSEHEEFFSALSINQNKKINNILEIGTYDGFNSLLLSNLFLYSKIDTIDLPENDEDFINFYGRKGQVDKFVEKRNNFISKNKNINFLSQNSLNLLNFQKKYDLIWIDGAHGYPVVCIDIINSLHVLNEKGIIMCDDVQINLHRNSPDKMFHSLATIETLNELKKSNLIEFKLIYKRLSAKNNCDEKRRKFIAVINKL